MKYIFIAIGLLILFLFWAPKNSHTEPLSSSATILAFGDSLTYGYNAKRDESYPSVLKYLSGLNVINAGINGETSAQGLKRLPKLLKKKNIKLMILFFGGNDIMQRLSIAQLKINLITMIHMAKEKQVQVLLISVPNISLFGLSPLALYEEVADEENVPLLNGMLADILEQPSLKSDQIHPNALGYKIMGKKIYEKLKKEGWLKD